MNYVIMIQIFCGRRGKVGGGGVQSARNDAMNDFHFVL